MKRIGIVGDIGSGKSYVAKHFGYPVFNADEEVSKIYNNLDKNVMKVFNVQNSVNSKNSYGGTSIKNIKKMISNLKRDLK